MEKAIEVKNLKVYFDTDDGIVRAVDGVSFFIARGEVLGIVGESGCGKTILSLAIMRMLPAGGKIHEGKIWFWRRNYGSEVKEEGKNLVTLPENEMLHLRGSAIGMIFQDPLTSLNPVFSIKEQLSRPIMIHQGLPYKTSMAKAVEMLDKVGIPAATNRISQFPHQFSGGQCQRIMIATVLSLKPELLIADEPTTALDVSIQAQILKLLKDLQEEFQTSMIFISHNLGVVAGISDRVAIMYAGWIVEEAPTGEIFDRPFHPYTKALLSAVPTIVGDRKMLRSLPGQPPSAGEEIYGCKLHSRCPEKIKDVCDASEPPDFIISNGHRVKCFLAG